MRFEGLRSSRRRDRNPARPRTRRVRPSAERLEGRALLTISIDPRPEVVAYIGQTDRLVAAEFTESDRALTAGDFAATIDWGDGTTSAGDISEAADGTFRVSAPKAYARPGNFWLGQGSYPITVTVTSPVNGDAASNAEVDSSFLESRGPGGGSARGIADGYVADDRAGAVVDYNNPGGGTALISVPGPGGGSASPTGLVTLPGSNGELVIVTSDGTIAVWTAPGGSSPLPAGQVATTVVDHSASGADYEGVTLGTVATAGGGPESVIFVANFASGKVEAYDASTFAPVALGSAAFADPSLPAGYAPFNVQDINGTVYVAFAEQSGAKDQAVIGAGLGYVDSFDASGHLLARFGTPGGFNAPTGIALAPADMGPYAGDLLVVNSGDGTISVLDPSDPSASALPGVLGRVAGPGGGPLVDAGLWGLSTTTFHEYDETYTYLYASSDASDDEIGSFFYNPTLVSVLTPPTTGIAYAPPVLVDYLGDPSPNILQFGQFIDAGGAVDGSDAGTLSVTIDWGIGSAPTAGTLAFESGANLPSGAGYVIEGTAPYTATGSYTATITVAMAGGASYTVQVPVVVADGTSPVIEPIGVSSPPASTSLLPFSFNAYTGDPARDFTVGEFFDADGTHDGRDLSRLSATIDWGDGSAPTPGHITLTTGGLADESVFYIDGTHHYGASGTYTAVLTVAMAGGSSYRVDVGVTVLDGTRPSPVIDPIVPTGPTIVPIASVTGTASAPTPGELGTFAGPEGSYTVSVDWGDGTPAAPGQVVQELLPGNPALAGSTPFAIFGGSHTYAVAGTYTITFVLTAPGGSTSTASTRATIAPARMGSRGNSIGLPASRPLTDTPLAFLSYDSTSTVAPAGSFLAEIDWRDGTITTGTVALVTPASGAGRSYYFVLGSHTYHTPGTYTPYIHVVAPDGESQWVADRVVVTPDPAGPSNILAGAQIKAARGIAIPDDLLATFDAPAGSFTVAVEWGDGSSPGRASVRPIGTSAGGLVEYAAYGSHTYAATGDYTVLLNILGPNGDSDWASDRVHVVAANFPPMDLTLQAIPGYRGIAIDALLAEFRSGDTLGGRYTANVDWGDGTQSGPATVETPAVPASRVVGAPLPPDHTVSGSHTYARSGTYTVTLEIIAPDGSETWTTTTATITAPPSGPVDFGTPGTLNAVQYVPTAGLAVAGFAATSADPYTAAIDWGDGSAPTFAAIVPHGGASTNGSYPSTNLPFFQIKGSHTYMKPGTYTVLVNLLGPGGLSEWTSNTVAVAQGVPLFDFPTVAQGRATSRDLVTFTYQNPPAGLTDSSFTAAIDWGDGSPLTFGSVRASSSSSSSGPIGESVVVGGTHTYLTPGLHYIGIALTTPDGETALTDVGVVVTADPTGPFHLAPVAVSGTQDVPLAGASLATFGLPASAANDGYVAAVEWGDGSAPAFATVSGAGSSSRGIAGSHTYAMPGTYTILINLIRSDGESLWTSTTATIAADAAPAVSGGLAAGAGTASPTYAGTATPGSVVGLYARPSGLTGPPTLLGTASAGPDGRWSITATGLAPGQYDVAALDTTSSGASAAALFGTLDVAPTASGPWFAALARARRIANRSRLS